MGEFQHFFCRFLKRDTNLSDIFATCAIHIGPKAQFKTPEMAMETMRTCCTYQGPFETTPTYPNSILTWNNIPHSNQSQLHSFQEGKLHRVVGKFLQGFPMRRTLQTIPSTLIRHGSIGISWSLPHFKSWKWNIMKHLLRWLHKIIGPAFPSRPVRHPKAQKDVLPSTELRHDDHGHWSISWLFFYRSLAERKWAHQLNCSENMTMIPMIDNAHSWSLNSKTISLLAKLLAKHVPVNLGHVPGPCFTIWLRRVDGGYPTLDVWFFLLLLGNPTCSAQHYSHCNYRCTHGQKTWNNIYATFI